MKGISINDLPERYRRQAERQLTTPDRPTIPATNLERAPDCAPVAPPRHPKVDTPCRLRLLCHRHRLADTDGISAKALIDGLIIARILADDTTKQIIESPVIAQIKVGRAEPEQTIVEIWG